MHVSNFKALKRAVDLVAVAKVALPQKPSLKFVLVGDGPYLDETVRACWEAGLSSHFRFPGWVGYDEMPKWINLADMVVMPAEDETQARVYLETQACGRALLASDIAAAREVVSDGETGVLFRMGDVGDLTKKVLRVAHDPQLRAMIGRNARRRVRAHDIDAAVATYTATFADLIRQQSSRVRDTVPQSDMAEHPNLASKRGRTAL